MMLTRILIIMEMIAGTSQVPQSSFNFTLPSSLNGHVQPLNNNNDVLPSWEDLALENPFIPENIDINPNSIALDFLTCQHRIRGSDSDFSDEDTKILYEGHLKSMLRCININKDARFLTYIMSCEYNNIIRDFHKVFACYMSFYYTSGFIIRISHDDLWNILKWLLDPIQSKTASVEIINMMEKSRHNLFNSLNNSFYVSYEELDNTDSMAETKVGNLTESSLATEEIEKYFRGTVHISNDNMGVRFINTIDYTLKLLSRVPFYDSTTDGTVKCFLSEYVQGYSRRYLTAILSKDFITLLRNVMETVLNLIPSSNEPEQAKSIHRPFIKRLLNILLDIDNNIFETLKIDDKTRKLYSNILMAVKALGNNNGIICDSVLPNILTEINTLTKDWCDELEKSKDVTVKNKQVLIGGFLDMLSNLLKNISLIFIWINNGCPNTGFGNINICNRYILENLIFCTFDPPRIIPFIKIMWDEIKKLRSEFPTRKVTIVN